MCKLLLSTTKMASADMSASPSLDGEGSMSAGEFVLKKLFAEFVVTSERKLQDIATQPQVRSLKVFVVSGAKPTSGPERGL